MTVTATRRPRWRSVSTCVQGLHARINKALGKTGEWLAPLGLRLILAWEFWESGVEKFRGENWFADIAGRFPWPFSVVPPEMSWQMATWFEIVGALALLVGLGTRFFSLALFTLTIVAIASVHWPENWSSLAELAQGYALTDRGFGNYKLPLIFLVMLWPLMLSGAGRLSLDAWLCRRPRG